MSKKVLFVMNTMGRAGAETALLEMLERFPQEEYCVDLFVLMAQGELADRIPAHVRLLNRKMSPESVLSGRGRLHMFGRVCRAALCRLTGLRLLPYVCKNALSMIQNHRIQVDKLLWRVLSDGSPRFQKEYDLAVAFIEGGSAYYVADHVKARKKVCFIHIDYRLAGYTRELDRDCYLKYDRVFPISDATMKSFLEAYPECEQKTFVFHNMINQAAILEKAKLPGGFEDSFDGIRILTVGRLTRQKAYPIAIEAMKLIKEAGVRARWYVLGEGEERKRLEQQIGSLGLQEDFLLLGAVDNPYPFFRQTDLYVHATAFEGKSIAIQEAQTLGCRIIASDILSNRQQLEHGVDGLLCRLDPESIRDAVLRLVRDPMLGEALGSAAARKKIVFDGDMGRILDLFTEG